MEGSDARGLERSKLNRRTVKERIDWRHRRRKDETVVNDETYVILTCITKVDCANDLLLGQRYNLGG